MGKKQSRKSDSQQFDMSDEATVDSVESCGSINSRVSTNSRVKREMQDLNGRLAHYIEIMRKTNNDSINHSDISNYQDRLLSIRDNYESEIICIKTHLEKVKADLSNSEFSKNELQKKMNKLFKDLSLKEKMSVEKSKLSEDLRSKLLESDKKIVCLQDEIKNLITEKNNYCDETISLSKELKELKKDKKGNMSEMTKYKTRHENEVRLRNLDRSLFKKCEEEYIDKIKDMEQKLDEKVHMEESFDRNMSDKLADLREEFEAEMFQLKEGLNNMYLKKIEYLENNISIKTEEIELLNKENRSLSSNLANLKNLYNDLNSLNSNLKSQVNEQKIRISEDAEKHKKIVLVKENRIDELSENLENLNDQYGYLLKDKTLLDAELETYKKLVEAEENRLNFEPKNKPVKRKSMLSLENKKVFKIEPVNNSDVLVFSDWSVDDGHITLKNVTNERLSLKGYSITMTTTDDYTLNVMKISEDLYLESDHILTIWSGSSDPRQHCQGDLICKSLANWFQLDDGKRTIKAVSLYNPQRINIATLSATITDDLDSSFVPYRDLSSSEGRKKQNCIIF